MRKQLIASLSVATLLFAACGGDNASGDQGRVADMLLDEAEKEELDLDKDCVNELASELSDDDAKAIADAGVDGDPEVSAAGEAIGDRIIECISVDGFIDTMVEELEASDDSIDTDCFREKLEDSETAEEVSENMISAAMECSG